MIVITMLSSVVIKLQHVFNFCLVHSQSVHILNFVIREREREMIWVGVHGNRFSLGHGLSSGFEAPMKVNGVKLWH